MNNEKVITLVTGGNQGMGLEIARELATKGQQVIIGARNLTKGQQAVDDLAKVGLTVDLVQLDVTDPKSLTAAAATIMEKYERLSVLVNNAGAVFDFRQDPSHIDMDSLRADFEINYFGLVEVTQKMIPLLKACQSAKIINISSMMGSKTEALNPNSEVYHAVAVGYQSAKAAANMYTVQVAKQFQRESLPITVNAIDPGMVATSFGGTNPAVAQKMGAQPVTTGVARTVELATDWTNHDTATFSNTQGPVAW